MEVAIDVKQLDIEVCVVDVVSLGEVEEELFSLLYIVNANPDAAAHPHWSILDDLFICSGDHVLCVMWFGSLVLDLQSSSDHPIFVVLDIIHPG